MVFIAYFDGAEMRRRANKMRTCVKSQSREAQRAKDSQKYRQSATCSAAACCGIPGWRPRIDPSVGTVSSRAREACRG